MWLCGILDHGACCLVSQWSSFIKVNMSWHSSWYVFRCCWDAKPRETNNTSPTFFLFSVFLSFSLWPSHSAHRWWIIRKGNYLDKHPLVLCMYIWSKCRLCNVLCEQITRDSENGTYRGDRGGGGTNLFKKSKHKYIEINSKQTSRISTYAIPTVSYFFSPRGREIAQLFKALGWWPSDQRYESNHCHHI